MQIETITKRKTTVTAQERSSVEWARFRGIETQSRFIALRWEVLRRAFFLNDNLFASMNHRVKLVPSP
jgi:hypothetical protein